MKELIKLARLRLKDEIKIIRQNYLNVLTELTVEEKAVLYWFTENGYEGLNQILRHNKGEKTPPFSILLDIALKKLSSYNFIVYRGVRFTTSRLEKYQNALERNEPIIEHAFMSTSIRRQAASQYGTIILRIFSKNGKLIENISKFGINSPFNEREVLFTKGSKFLVLDIKEENPYFIITLEEI